MRGKTIQRFLDVLDDRELVPSRSFPMKGLTFAGRLAARYLAKQGRVCVGTFFNEEYVAMGDSFAGQAIRHRKVI